MIVGAQKCGTSTLYDILNLHPKLEGSKEKEPGFFSANTKWKSQLAGYEKNFSIRDGAKYFEASTNYTFYPHLSNKRIWDDIYEYNPDMKFIYIVRNPIDRIISSYMHGRQRGGIKREVNDNVINNTLCLDITRYYKQILPVVTKFGLDHVAIIDFDDLNKNRTNTINLLAKFLEIKFDFPENLDAIHTNNSIGKSKVHRRLATPARITKKLIRFFPQGLENKIKDVYEFFAPKFGMIVHNEKPELSNKTKRFILDSLNDDIDSLAKLMGKDLSHWKKI